MLWKLTRLSRFKVLEKRFFETHRIKYAILAAQEGKKIPLNQWLPFMVLGKFAAVYFLRYRRRWVETDFEFKQMYSDAVLLMNREGVDSACKGIDIIFSKEMSWVDCQWSKLLNKHFFRKYIRDKIDIEKGEQTEWKDRKNTHSHEKVSL